MAANRELRERAMTAAENSGLRLVVPPFRACTDKRGDDRVCRLDTTRAW
ncbi:MAG: hypothetical protein HYZ29_08690 [Myxococcales bacterium]|nr:hypothetical protein [Myxococcales bacterium]